MARAASLVFVVASIALAAPARGIEPTLPNLVPLPAFEFRIAPADDPNEGRALRFSVATANRGRYALDLFGRPEDAAGRAATAHQCISWTTDRVCSERTEVGRFSWHPEHGHMHLEDFALYELRRFRSDGRVRMDGAGLVATSGKVSYCVIDVEPDRAPDSPLYSYPHPLYYSCFVGGFQGISPGWRDVYSWQTIGQQFRLTELVDGRYALVVYADPEDRLHETVEKDNVSVVGIELSDGLKKVSVFCRSEPPDRRCLSTDR